MKAFNIISLILIVVGALNWGLVGLFGVDLLATILGGRDAALTRIVYVLVGLAGLYALSFFTQLRHFEHGPHQPARA